MLIPESPKQQALLTWLQISVDEHGLGNDIKNATLIACGWFAEDLYCLVKREEERVNIGMAD